jgi:hypothetical protein
MVKILITGLAEVKSASRHSRFRKCSLHGVQDRPLIVRHHACWLEVRSNQSLEPLHDLAVECLLLACH